MPKTSIGRKKLDSKNKRQFNGRQKKRHIKKNKNKDFQDDKYENKFEKLKAKEELETQEKIQKSVQSIFNKGGDDGEKSGLERVQE